MNRAKITALVNNADAAALKTAAAALDGTSGQAVLSGGKVSFSISAAAAEQFLTGDMVGYAYVPTVVSVAGVITTRAWARWPGGDFSLPAGEVNVLKGPIDVPPGAFRVIALPLNVTDSIGTTSFSCGSFFYAPSDIG